MAQPWYTIFLAGRPPADARFQCFSPPFKPGYSVLDRHSHDFVGHVFRARLCARALTADRKSYRKVTPCQSQRLVSRDWGSWG